MHAIDESSATFARVYISSEGQTKVKSILSLSQRTMVMVDLGIADELSKKETAVLISA